MTCGKSALAGVMALWDQIRKTLLAIAAPRSTGMLDLGYSLADLLSRLYLGLTVISKRRLKPDEIKQA